MPFAELLPPGDFLAAKFLQLVAETFGEVVRDINNGEPVVQVIGCRGLAAGLDLGHFGLRPARSQRVGELSSGEPTLLPKVAQAVTERHAAGFEVAGHLVLLACAPVLLVRHSMIPCPLRPATVLVDYAGIGEQPRPFERAILSEVHAHQVLVVE